MLVRYARAVLVHVVAVWASESFNIHIQDPGKTSTLSFQDSANRGVDFSADKDELRVMVNSQDVLSFKSNMSTASADGSLSQSLITADGGLSVKGALIAEDMDVDTSNPLAQWYVVRLSMATHLCNSCHIMAWYRMEAYI